MSIRRHFEIALLVSAALTATDAWADPSAKPAGGKDDSLAAYRERFQLGMDQYKAGALGNAIAYWEPVYVQLGPREGYRLAYDLGIAYSEVGDATLAAERLQSFLDEVTMRREAGEAVGAIVTKEEGDARARLVALVAGKTRIHVAASPGLRVQIDQGSPRPAGFVAWLAPGQHTVTFTKAPTSVPGATASETTEASARAVVAPDIRVVDAHAGEIVDIAPRSPAAASAPLVPSAARVLASAAPSAKPAPARAEPRVMAPGLAPAYRRVHHPFSPAFIVASGAVATAAAALAIPLEIHANTLHSRFAGQDSTDGAISSADRQTFSDARNLAYGMLAGAIGFGVVTGALTTWYFFGSSKREPPVEPSVVQEHGGASFSLRGRF